MDKQTVTKLKKLKALMLRLALRDEPGFDVSVLDCGTYACVDGWAIRKGLAASGPRFLEGFELTENQRQHICYAGAYLASTWRDPKVAARHIQDVIDGKVS